MDDVATLKSENANQRRIQARLLQWEQKDNGLAPLSAAQNEFINQLAESLGGGAGTGGGGSAVGDFELEVFSFLT